MFFFKQINQYLVWLSTIFLIGLSLQIQGCASSNLSREASKQFDDGVHPDSRKGYTNPGEAFQNSSQQTKGVILGGVTGAALATTLTSGVGILPAAAGGAIFGGALGAWIDQNTSLEDRLMNRGGRIVILGDQVLIIVPSRNLFYTMSGDLKPAAYPLLNEIVQIINHYPNILIKVNAYGGDDCNFALSLTEQQSQAIMKYLWAQGADTRLLRAQGYGNLQPVENTSHGWGYGDNYRVEILFEKLPV